MIKELVKVVPDAVFLFTVCALGFFIRKWILSLEEKIKTLCVKLDCKVEVSEVKELWERVHHHKHSPEDGKVIII